MGLWLIEFRDSVEYLSRYLCERPGHEKVLHLGRVDQRHPEKDSTRLIELLVALSGAGQIDEVQNWRS